MLTKIYRKGSPYTLLLKISIGEATIENNIKIPQEIKTRIIIKYSTPISRYISEYIFRYISVSKVYLHCPCVLKQYPE